jgi:carboxymethylenebutenolidase
MAKGTMVEFHTPRGSGSGYVMGMVHGRGRPGVIVLHEARGLVAHMKDVVNRFAHEGFDAMAPDLHHGAVATDGVHAALLWRDFDWRAAIPEVVDAVDYLRHADHDTRMALVGFGMGGALAMLAAQPARVSAYVSFYGFPPSQLPLGPIAAPGLLFHGDEDHTFPRKDAEAFAQRQTRGGVITDLVTYTHAGHGFFNDARPEEWRQMPARTAWSRTLAFLNRNVKGLAAATA